MKVYISADIEGTCGIVSWAETERSTAMDYTPFQNQMNREVNAACEGALEAGSEYILVKDAHDSARNLDHMQLPRQASMHRGWSGDLLSMMSGLDEDKFGAVCFTGYHSAASVPGNPLSHTMNLANDYITINGIVASEFLLNAFTAGYFGVPVCFLSGDQELCDFASNFIPEMVTVPVSKGKGGSATSIHPMEAVDQIKAGVKAGLAKADKCQVPMPNVFNSVIRFRDHKLAYSKHFYPGATLEDNKNLCFSTDDWYEMLRYFHFVLSDA